MPIALGTTLRCNHPPRHVWIVLSDPARTGGDVLLVNLTTLTEDCVDDVCILAPSDFGLLTHPTTVAYSRAQIGTAAKLDALVRAGDFALVTAVPAVTLKRILQGASVSRELPAAKKRLIG